MIILNKDQLTSLKKYTKSKFNEWFGFKISAKNHRELLACLTNSNSDAHLSKRLKDGPVQMAHNIEETNFEKLYSDIYKISLSKFEKDSINAFLWSTIFEMIPVPDIDFTPFGESISLKKALDNSYEYRKINECVTDNDYLNNDNYSLSNFNMNDKKALKELINKRLLDNYNDSESSLSFEQWKLENPSINDSTTRNVKSIAIKKRIDTLLSNGCNLEYLYRKISDIKYEHIKDELLKYFSEDDYLITWHIYEIKEASYEDAIRYKSGDPVKKVFMAIYSNNKFIPVGAGSTEIKSIKEYGNCDFEKEISDYSKNLDEKKMIIQEISRNILVGDDIESCFIDTKLPLNSKLFTAKEWFYASTINWDYIRDEFYVPKWIFHFSRTKVFSVNNKFQSLEFWLLQRLNEATWQSTEFSGKEELHDGTSGETWENNAERLKIPFYPEASITIVDSSLIKGNHNLIIKLFRDYSDDYPSAIIMI